MANVLVGLAGVLLLSVVCQGQATEVLQADFRLRPPLMDYGTGLRHYDGVLVRLLEQACLQAGCTVQWREMPFPRSLYHLKTGEVHLVPRLIRTPEREAFAHFIGPVAEEALPVLFVKRKQARLDSEQQLLQGTLGVKSGTFYSRFINDDPRLQKYLAADDINLARMFIAGRFDYIAVIDRSSMETAFRQLQFSDYDYAPLRYDNRVEVYYGFSRTASHQEFADKLQAALSDLVQQSPLPLPLDGT